MVGAKKKPLWRQNEVIPKVNSIEMFEIPVCRSTQGRPFALAPNLPHQIFLSPFPENIAASTDNAVFVNAGVPIGKSRCSTLGFLAWSFSGKGCDHKRVSRDIDLGVFRSLPGHRAPLQIEQRLLASARMLTRFSPDNSPEAIYRFLSQICADGENPHAPGIG